MDTPIQIQDFDVQILHQDDNLKQSNLGQTFQITHRRMWIKRPTKIRYEPSLILYLWDRSKPLVDDQNYKGVYLAMAGKGTFTIENKTGITDNDLAACVMEIGKKMNTYTEENKEQLNGAHSPVQPQLNHVLEQVRSFLNKELN